ncbi:hypothetical protein [Noviherbaspirillum autotrophicum]|uniref:Uncharacterized protein n=1 Tax=Noviherbaspirillum autotrophicum TaxID=709839 RepID=A0A0C1Y7T9_9BURK|nr:hypothetical protein TSA66_22440 [Noviherbaspirillum autotrophicum]
MELPDASLELVFSVEARVPRFKTGAVLLAAGAVFFAPAARAAAGTAFCAAAALTGAAFAKRLTAALVSSAAALLFTVVLAGLATVFGVATVVFLVGAVTPEIVFVSLLAVLPGDLALGALAGLVATFFVALLAAAFLVADLVTVAFIFILFLS